MIGDKKNNPNKVPNAHAPANLDYCAKEQRKDADAFHREFLKNGIEAARLSGERCSAEKTFEVEPLPETYRPRKDGPGGE